MLEYLLVIDVSQGVLEICYKAHELTTQEDYSIKVSNEA